jgi:hypothetical protein
MTDAYLSVPISFRATKTWRTLYSDEYTVDHQPRQNSIEFCEAGFSDCGKLVGYPDQFYPYQSPWIRMTEERSWWFFEVQCLSCFGKRFSALNSAQRSFAKADWVEFMDDKRCFTNDNGTTTHHDYITGRNPDKGDMYYQTLILGGNVVDVLSDTGMLPERYFNKPASYPHRRIRAVNPNNLPTPEDFLKDPAVCHLCTTIKPTGEHGLFPQFDEKARCVLWAKDPLYVWERLIG